METRCRRIWPHEASRLPARKAVRAALKRRYDALQQDPAAAAAAWETLWLDAHRWRRKLALANPLADVGPLLFVKHVPSTMSHQLTQYYGYTARPGGGLFVLAEPGRSMRVRRLAAAMPEGNYLHPEVSFDGRSRLFRLLRVRHGAGRLGRSEVSRPPLSPLRNEGRRLGDADA